MKKVLAIAPYPYLPFFSGGQKFIARFYHHLAEKVQLTVISVPQQETPGNYEILPLLKPGFSRYWDLSLIKQITTLTRAKGFDAIIWEHPYYGWLANAVRKRTGIRTIIHTHNIEYQRFRSTGRWWWPLLRTYEKWTLRKADHIFFITDEDRGFAIREWKIPASKCSELPFGIEGDQPPRDRKEAGIQLRKIHGIAADERIILFNGLLNYKPNRDALYAILDRINPLLQQNNRVKYRILICGKGLPEELQDLAAYRQQHVLYAGFVSDIDLYFRGADIFLNPVQSGGGIKTKMVEAIGWGLTVIASRTGALGIREETCGEKIWIVPDNDWPGFVRAIEKQLENEVPTPASFYEHYSWQKIIEKVTTNASI